MKEVAPRTDVGSEYSETVAKAGSPMATKGGVVELTDFLTTLMD
jgi:hypothetical protein